MASYRTGPSGASAGRGSSPSRSSFGSPMPPGATESPRSYGNDNAKKPCADDRVSYPDAWHKNEEAEGKAPASDRTPSGRY